MKIVVTAKHCTDIYSNPFGCAVFLAIQEQYPNFPLKSVGPSHVRSKDEKTYQMSQPFTPTLFNELKEGRKQEVIINLKINI